MASGAERQAAWRRRERARIAELEAQVAHQTRPGAAPSGAALSQGSRELFKSQIAHLERETKALRKELADAKAAQPMDIAASEKIVAAANRHKTENSQLRGRLRTMANQVRTDNGSKLSDEEFKALAKVVHPDTARAATDAQLRAAFAVIMARKPGPKLPKDDLGPVPPKKR